VGRKVDHALELAAVVWLIVYGLAEWAWQSIRPVR
jgi:hypothetical protein